MKHIHPGWLATHSRPEAMSDKDVYFGIQKQCLGNIQRWENYPSYGFPFEHECEECGWSISYIDEMVMINAGTHGKNHYHKHCWDDKINENRVYPKFCTRYGYNWKWTRNSPKFEVPVDAIWDKERETFMIKCKLCDRMIRATPYYSYEKGYAPNHCGKCTRERVCT